MLSVHRFTVVVFSLLLSFALASVADKAQATSANDSQAVRQRGTGEAPPVVVTADRPY